MSVTFCVSKLETSSSVSLLQFLNMLLMSVTFRVSKLETLSSVRLLQLLNMLFMFTTFSVLRYSIPSMVFKSVHPKNQQKQLVGRAAAKEASNTTFSMRFLFTLYSPSTNQLGSSSGLFSGYAPAGFLTSCLKVSVPVASSNTAYDSGV